ncbi:MAG: hypothetical protein IJT51_02130, partial [Bacteroidales bacterium]|nr:hypothetical protein [Bacteroidales bacterium]
NYNAVVDGSDSVLTLTAESSTNQPNGVYSYTVVINEGTPCAVTSDPFYVTVADSILASVIVADSELCAGGVAQVAAQINNWNIENLTFAWTANGETLPYTTASFTDAVSTTTEYEVTVTDVVSGCTAVASANVNVNAPTVVMTSLNSASICEGNQITLEATTSGDDNLGTPTFTWYANGQVIAGATQSTYTYSPLTVDGDATIYNYSVEVSYAHSGCYAADTTTNDITVYPNPTVAISGDNMVCENDTVSLTANVTNVNGLDGSALTYTWYNYNAVVSGTDSVLNVTAVPSLNQPNGVYSYTVVINEGTPCAVTSDPFLVTVNAAPVVNVTVSADSICVGSKVTFTANLNDNNATNLTYQWADKNGNIAGATQATYTTPVLTTADTYNYTVTVTQTTTGCTAVDSNEVVVVADPIVTVSVDTAAMCVGGHVQVTAQVTGGLSTDNVTFTWKVNGITVPNVSGDTYYDNLNVAGVYNYSASVAQTENYHLTGCASTFSSVATVTVYNQPEVYISTIGLIDACEGGTITLNAEVYGDNAVISTVDYDWRMNGSNLDLHTNIINTSDTLPAGPYNYTVVVTPNLMACHVISDNINTTVVEDPSWSRNIVAYSPICEGESVDLYAEVQDGLGGTIQWWRYDSINGTLIEINQGGLTYDQPAANGTESGVYGYYPVFSEFGSGCELPFDSTVVTRVEVYARPTASAMTADGSDVICLGESADIVINFTGIAPYTYTVQNMMNGQVIGFDTYDNPDTLTVYPTTTTIYKITQVANGVCAAYANEAAEFVTVVVSHIEFTDALYETGCSDSVALANTQLTFNVISGGVPSQETYRIYAADGITLLQDSLPITGNFVTIDMTGYAAGTYDFIVEIDECTYPVTVRVNMPNTIFEQRWDDVLVCNNNPANNGGYNFVSYQ